MQKLFPLFSLCHERRPLFHHRIGQLDPPPPSPSLEKILREDRRTPTTFFSSLLISRSTMEAHGGDGDGNNEQQRPHERLLRQKQWEERELCRQAFRAFDKKDRGSVHKNVSQALTVRAFVLEQRDAHKLPHARVKRGRSVARPSSFPASPHAEMSSSAPGFGVKDHYYTIRHCQDFDQREIKSSR